MIKSCELLFYFLLLLLRSFLPLFACLTIQSQITMHISSFLLLCTLFKYIYSAKWNGTPSASICFEFSFTLFLIKYSSPLSVTSSLSASFSPFTVSVLGEQGAISCLLQQWFHLLQTPTVHLLAFRVRNQ